jgi:glutathione S-transferase
MFALHHHPLCPRSRFVRLALAEHGLESELVEVTPWRPDGGLRALDIAGEVPVLVETGVAVVPGAAAIMEYLDETRGASLGERRLMPEDPRERVEVRRLVAWFLGKLDSEATAHLLRERIHKRFMRPDEGGGPPDMGVVRAARANLGYHFEYAGWLADERDWLAGARMSFADLAAAAQISCVDYLGDAPWNGNESARTWYARMKSRPSFRGLLADRILGAPPSAHYADLDF